MLLVMGLVGFLVLKEPDLGAYVMMLAISMGILFLGGINLTVFIMVLVGVLGLLVFMILRLAGERLVFRLPGSLGNFERSGQGLSALAFADRIRPGRELGRRLRRCD